MMDINRMTKKELVRKNLNLKSDIKRLEQEIKALGKISAVDQGKITELEADLKEENFLRNKADARADKIQMERNRLRTTLQILNNAMKPDIKDFEFDKTLTIVAGHPEYPQTFKLLMLHRVS
jgi:hypothetical protein